jgi:uncharacterized protein YqhQ
VVEGVMMRGRRSAAVAVRVPAGGIVVLEEALNARVYSKGVAQWPFVRGLVLLWDMLILGTRMMMFAANLAVQPALPDDSGDAKGALSARSARSARSASTGNVVEADAEATAGIGGAGMTLTLVLSLAVGIGIFFLLPLATVGLLRPWIGAGWPRLAAEGLIRLALLIGYLAIIGRFPSIQRVFMYHGAEHKAINCFEAGKPLDVANVRVASRVHTRCGTGFLLIVVVVSILVFAFLGTPPLPLLILSRILLVPVIASIAYELMRLGAANYRFRVVHWLMAPSLALQGLTTREPDDGQIECAITALERVLNRDGVPVLQQVA